MEGAQRTMDQSDRVALTFAIVTMAAALAVPVLAVLAVGAGGVLVFRGWRWAALIVVAALAAAAIGWQANGPTGVLRERTDCARLEPGLQRNLCESGVYD